MTNRQAINAVSKRYAIFIAIVGTAFCLIGCSATFVPQTLEQGPLTIAPSSVLAPGLTNAYEAQAMAIIQQNCVSCHTQTSGPDGIYDLTDIDHLISSDLIVSGSPQQSALYIAVSSGVMPPTGALSASDQQTIQSWIASGGTVVAVPTPTPTPLPTATPTPTATPAEATVTFSTISTQIFEPKCVSCHSTASPAGGYAFDTYANVVKFVNTTAVASTPFYTVTKSGGMPLNGTALTAAQETLLLTWLQQGYKNN